MFRQTEGKVDEGDVLYSYSLVWCLKSHFLSIQKHFVCVALAINYMHVIQIKSNKHHFQTSTQAGLNNMLTGSHQNEYTEEIAYCTAIVLQCKIISHVFHNRSFQQQIQNNK